MYLEIYLDVLFLVNWIMDFIILALAHKILRSRGNYIRIVLGSAAASLSYCVLILLTGIPYLVREILLFTVVYLVVIKISLNIKNIRMLIKAALLVYVVSIFIGGLFHLAIVHIFNKQTSLKFLYFLIISISSFFLIRGLYQVYITFFVKKQNIYPVTVRYRGNTIKVNGLLDTGNSLVDPISKKPVCIIEAELIHEWIKDMEYEKYRYIPYHSIGKNHGLLKGIIVDKLIIEKDTDEVVIEEPLLGIYDSKLSVSGKYRLILNPMLVDC